MGPDQYVILVYDIPSRQLEMHGFEENYPAAVEAYDQFEREHREDGSVEIVLVGADSIETIHKTHSRYFAQHADDLFRQFLEGSPAPVGAHDNLVIRASTSKPRRRRRGA